MRNLDEKITRRQAMQEQVVAMLRSTTNKVCKTMTAITGAGTISQARQELNDGIRSVRSLIRQLENDPTPYESILRTERNALGNFSKDLVCEMYGDKSEECLLACLAIDAGDAPGNTFTPDDLETAWDITQSPPVPIPGIDTCEGTDGVFIPSNPDWKPGDEIPDTIGTDSQIEEANSQPVRRPRVALSAKRFGSNNRHDRNRNDNNAGCGDDNSRSSREYFEFRL